MREFTRKREWRSYRPKDNGAQVPAGRVTLEAQGHLLRLKMSGPAPVGAGGRGQIQEFTRQSRKRMLEKMARIDTDKAGFVCFLTLTYPDREGPPSTQETERDRIAFVKRLRRAYPRCSGIWRRESESRKSGKFSGVSFPHYHLLVFNLPFVRHEIINEMWRDVLQWAGPVRTEIKGVKAWRQAFYYVSKYMAKEHGGINVAAAPDGGPAGVFGAAAGEADRSLVYGTYLAERKEGSIGRAWGVFNAKSLPYAEREVNRLPGGAWVEEARRLVRREWPGVPDDANCGFTLFTENADAWMFRLCALQDGEELTEVSKEELAAIPF